MNNEKIGTCDGTLATVTFEILNKNSSFIRLSNVTLIDSDGLLLQPQSEDTEIGQWIPYGFRSYSRYFP